MAYLSLDLSLLDDDIPEHFEVLCVCLLVVGLVIVPHETVEDVELNRVCGSDCWQSQAPAALQELVASATTCEHSRYGHHSDGSGDSCSEASLGLPDAEALMVIEKIG